MSSAECVYRVGYRLYLPLYFGSRVKIWKARRSEKFWCWSIRTFTACDYVASAIDVEFFVRNNTTFYIYLRFISTNWTCGTPSYVSTISDNPVLWLQCSLVSLYLPTDQYDNCRIIHLPFSKGRSPYPVSLLSEFWIPLNRSTNLLNDGDTIDILLDFVMGQARNDFRLSLAGQFEDILPKSCFLNFNRFFRG